MIAPLVGIVSLLIALTMSLMVTRVAAMALVLTGMSREAAKFQARSAFTGVGYTTGEAEQLVNHPVRRRIIMLLMLLGNVGVATVAATVMVSFLSASAASGPQRIWTVVILAGGLLGLWLTFSSSWVERRMNRLIAWALKRFTDLDARDYVALLELSRGFAITEMIVDPGDWLEGKTLAQLRLSDEGILVLSMRSRGGQFHGTPRGEDVVHSGDTLILYGELEAIEQLDRRRAGRAGDREHLEAVEEQDEFEEAERQRREAGDAE